MAYYLLQASYTAEGWAAQIKHPQDVRARVQAAMEKLAATLSGFGMRLGTTTSWRSSSIHRM